MDASVNDLPHVGRPIGQVLEETSAVRVEEQLGALMFDKWMQCPRHGFSRNSDEV
jgi:hypothetical protein